MATATRERQAVTRIPATYAEYLVWADESALVEWKDGEIITYMPPTDRHQDVLRFLTTLLDSFVDALGFGALRYAPLEVKLWPDGPSREPDILIVNHERLGQLTAKRFEGGPDLVVEIVSNSSARADRVEKLIEYERAGVREYWVIDPRRGKEHAEFYQLDENGRFASITLDDKGVYHSAVLPGFWLHPDWLRAQILPSPALKMATIAKDLTALPDDVRAVYRAHYDALNREKH